MDFYSLFSNRDIGGMRVNPGSAIEIVDSVLGFVHGGVGMAAKDARRLTMTAVGEGTIGDL
jgi:hypothetical protein